MRHKGILLVVMAALLATAGVAYAHWTDTLAVNAQVNTGTLSVDWADVFTNDDGEINGYDTGDDNDGEIYDRYPTNSSRDPAVPGAAGDDERYDKDVARCFASGTEGVLSFTVENGYPSYHCDVNARIVNNGSVPVKATSFAYTLNGLAQVVDPATGVFTLGNGEITGEIAMGLWCGTQVDPGEDDVFAGGWLHIEQAAQQNFTYAWSAIQTFVNWNEFSYCLCNDGVPAANGAGDLIGIVDTSEEATGGDCLVP